MGVITKILMIYIIGTICAFAAMIFFLRKSISREDEEEFAYYESGYCDYEYGRIVFGILQTVVSIFVAAMWPFIPLIVAGLYIYEWVGNRFPGLMGHLSDEKEDADSD